MTEDRTAKRLVDAGELHLADESTNYQLRAKVQFLVDRMDELGLLEDHSFTFPDGDTWTATGA